MLLVDLKKAFQSVVVALATGPIPPHDLCAALPADVGSAESEATELLAQLREGKCELRAWCASAGSAGNGMLRTGSQWALRLGALHH